MDDLHASGNSRRSGDPPDAMKRIGFLYPEPRSALACALVRHASLARLGPSVTRPGHRPDRLPPPAHRAPCRLRALECARAGRRCPRSPVKSSVRSRVLARRLLRAQPLDALLAMGTDQYDLPRVVPDSLPVATYDDGTFALFMRHPESPARRSGFPEPEIRRWAARQAAAARRATACCVSTRWAASSLIDDYGVPARKVHVVGIGHRPRPSALHRDWSSPRLLFVGVGWEQKNGDTVLRAFARLRADAPVGHARRRR